MWAGSRFLLGVCGLAATFYLEYVDWQSGFYKVCELAAGFYLEYVGWQQVSIPEVCGLAAVFQV
jgi:hypothetical protein